MSLTEELSIKYDLEGILIAYRYLYISKLELEKEEKKKEEKRIEKEGYMSRCIDDSQEQTIVQESRNLNITKNPVQDLSSILDLLEIDDPRPSSKRNSIWDIEPK